MLGYNVLTESPIDVMQELADVEANTIEYTKRELQAVVTDAKKELTQLRTTLEGNCSVLIQIFFV